MTTLLARTAPDTRRPVSPSGPTGYAPGRAPGPKGPAANVANLLRLQRNAPALFSDLHARYGDLVRLPLGPYLTHLNLHPDGIKHVLADNNANYVRGRMYDRFKLFFGYGLLTTDGADWKARRRRVNPAFHKSAIESMTTAMTEATDLVLDRWHAASMVGAPLDALPDVMDLALEAMGRILFRTGLEKHSARVAPAMAVSLDAMIFKGTVSQLIPQRVPTPHHLRIDRAVGIIDAQVRSIIDAHREPPADGKADLVDLLLHSDPEQPPSEAEVVDEMKTVFMAGHETTGTGLGWGLYELARHPEAQEEMAAEVDTVLAGRTPTFEDLRALPVTRRVVEETLRLHPPIWLFPRDAVDHDEIAGCHIPAGSSVFMVPYVTHRDPQWWSEPERFDPSRFTPEAAADRPRFAYLPFGGGQRQCIGYQMALLQMQLTFAMAVQRYRIEPANPQDPELGTLVSLRPVDGFPLRLRSRG